MSGSERPDGPPPEPYQVFVHTTFHLSGDAERYRVGGFADCAGAQAACRRVVDHFLQAHYREGVSAEELFSAYREAGPDPFIRTADRDCIFAAEEYARERCAELCGGRGGRRGG